MEDAVDDYYTAKKDATLSVLHVGGVGDNDSLCGGGSYSFTSFSDPPNGTVIADPNQSDGFDYTPDPGFIGTDSFTYTLVNYQVDVDQATVHITVTESCSMIAVPNGYAVPPAAPFVLPAPGFLANDVLECQYDVVVVPSGPMGGQLTVTGVGGFEYTPLLGFLGADQFVYEIQDANQQVLASSVVTLFVLAPDPCEAYDDFHATPMDQTLSVSPPGVLANDGICPDWDQVVVYEPPDHGSVNLAPDTGGFEYVPSPGYTGPDFFTYEFKDENGGPVSGPLGPVSVHLYVTEAPPAPTSTAPGTSEPAIGTSGPGTMAPGVDTTGAPTTGPADGGTTQVATTGLPAATTVPESVDDTLPPESTVVEADRLRVATFHASLTRAEPGELTSALSTQHDSQAASVAEVIQRNRPDVILLSGFDYAGNGEAVDLFRTNYLDVSQNGADPVEYPYAFTAPVNRGVASGFDLDNDGAVDGPGDRFGPGAFPGQAGMVVLSRFPIVTDQVRTFQQLPWASVPGAQLPDDPATPEPADWYSAEELDVLPLSSTSHWDVPIDVDGRVVHLLASNPALPIGGATDRDIARNADEIGFWADYVAGADTSWIVDDAGTSGGLAVDAEFVIVGTLKSDPLDGESAAAIQQLVGLDRVQDPEPASEGGYEAATTQGLPNTSHEGHPAHDTADLPDHPGPGNLRIDYVLPSDSLEVLDAGVFWPPTTDPLSDLVAPTTTSSGHRLVWVDIA